MLETTKLLGQNIRSCAEQKSGTLFLITNNNNDCHILLDKGRTTAMAFGFVRGVAVVDILPRLSVKTSQSNRTADAFK